MPMFGMKSERAGFQIDERVQSCILVNPLINELRAIAQVGSSAQFHRTETNIGGRLAEVQEIADEEPIAEAMDQIHGEVRKQTRDARVRGRAVGDFTDTRLVRTIQTWRDLHPPGR